MRPFTRIVIAFLCALFAGCARPDPRTVRIAGSSPGAVKVWRAKIEDQLPPAQWHEFDAALQELRWSVKPDNVPATSPATAEALGKLIDGLTLDEVLRLGYEAKLLRLESIRGGTKEAVDMNALLASRDEESVNYLNRYRREQQERLVALDEELRATARRFAELGGTRRAPRPGDPPRPVLGDVNPATLSRQEALREIDALIDKRREAAAFTYGAWPVKFDELGTSLPLEEQSDFVRRRTEAEASGRMVIAVRLKEKWRIFDAPVDVPTFPPAVVANLTAADRKQIAAKWTRLQAELWARSEDRAESTKPK